MNNDGQDDLSGFSMLDLFRVELENQKTVLTAGLLALEQDPTDDARLESLMRAAHSIKGAARIVNLDPAVVVAHKMEDVFEAVRRDAVPLAAPHLPEHASSNLLPPALQSACSLRQLLVDLMLAGLDLIERIAGTQETDIGVWSTTQRHEIDAFVGQLEVYLQLHQQPAASAPASMTAAPRVNADADPADLSMIELFRIEVGNQKTVLTDRLLALESAPEDPALLEALMRAAHSIKGAARIVNLDAAVKVAHGMEDAFEALRCRPDHLNACPVENLAAVSGLNPAYHQCDSFVSLLTDIMLAGVDLLDRIAGTAEEDLARWSGAEAGTVSTYLSQLSLLLGIFNGTVPPAAAPLEKSTSTPTLTPATAPPRPGDARRPAERGPESNDAFLRITANNLNRVLALAGEAQIETQRLRPFAEDLTRLKRQLADLNLAVDNLRDALASEHLGDEGRARLAEVRDRVAGSRRDLNAHLADLESIGRRHANVSGRLYQAAIACRMRPFRDGIQAFPRMVRDISRQLGKQVRLEILGEDTQVDRDILERLEALITQLLRNAIDHGFESAEERADAGKKPIGRLTLEARHSSGKLLVSVADDGRGIDYEQLRAGIVRKRLTTSETAERLSDAELLEFLFLPGFSQKETVTEISGRGVGLDIVYNMVKSVRGTVRVYNNPGVGTRFELQLPLTLSVLRGLLVSVNGQPYAFPLAEIQGTLKLDEEVIDRSGTLPTASIQGETTEIVPVARIFDQYTGVRPGPVRIILIGDRDAVYALQVDDFLGECELVVQPLDPRLGKIQDISAGALMDDGNPVLIVDVQDLVRGAERICRGETVFLTRSEVEEHTERRRVLVVDDSLTVREMERQLLVHAGYDVTVAIDGVDAWNAIRSAPQPFHLVVTDMDMPRMSGIELCELIRTDTTLGDLPIIMITYKDRQEARLRAIETGVDLFLTKAEFDDDTFLADVGRLIGGA